MDYDVTMYDFNAKVKIELNNNEVVECQAYIKTNGHVTGGFDDLTGEGYIVDCRDYDVDTDLTSIELIEAESDDLKIDNKIATIGTKRLIEVIEADWQADEDTACERV